MGARHRMSYTASDGKSNFRFELCELPESWRIYICQQPSYGKRAADASIVHRLATGPRNYICWTGKIATRGQAEALARLWADKTAEYIATGRRF